MKKIEISAPLRFVLIILIWLLTFTVVNVGAALNNGGVGLIGTLVLYAGALFLAFVYFNDCALKRACKLSLIVMVILTVCYLGTQCYGYMLDAFDVEAEGARKAENAIENLYFIGRNVTMAVFLIINLVQSLSSNEGACCSCNNQEAKEANNESRVENNAVVENNNQEEKEIKEEN